MARAPRLFNLCIVQCAIIDQSARLADLRHDIVAGVDTQCAGDAADLRPFANIDTCRANSDTLVAVDTVAECSRIGLRRLQTAALLPTPFLVGHEQRLFVHHRSLDSRPRAHIDAHLLAHEAAENKGCCGQYADRRIRNGRRLARPEIAHQCRCVGEIHDPCASGPKGDKQPYRPFSETLGDFLRAPRCLFQPGLRVAVAINIALDMQEQIGPNGLRTGIAAPSAANRAGHQE